MVQKPSKKFIEAELMKIPHKPLWATKTRIPAILQHLQCCLEKADTPVNKTVTDAASSEEPVSPDAVTGNHYQSKHKV